jgi:hypothetical protein
MTLLEINQARRASCLAIAAAGLQTLDGGHTRAGDTLMPTAPLMCLDGEIVPYDEAKIHAFAGVDTYGCDVFEGIRAPSQGQDPPGILQGPPRHPVR